MYLEENIDLHKTISDSVSVSMIKKDTIKTEGNPGIKPPNRKPDDETNNLIYAKHKFKNIKSGIQVTRLRSKRPLMTYQSSLNDPCPSIILNTIYLNNNDEVNSISDPLNISKMKNLLSSHRSIPFHQKKLSQHLSKSIKSTQKKIKSNEEFLLQSISEETPKDKTKNQHNAMHI